MTVSNDDRLERTLRPSRVTGVRVDPVLTAILLAELLTPSKDIWLVSAWISDVAAVDNTQGSYDNLFGDAVARAYTLSEILGMLARRATRITVVTRDVPENEAFLARIGRAAGEQGQVRVVLSPSVHEKTFCGDDWMLTGSMNFTFGGMNVNDEAVTYKVDRPTASAARVDFVRRWENA